MARKRMEQDFSNVSSKVMRRKKPINSDHMVTINPLTKNQQIVFEEYSKGKNLFLHGCAGTGKSFTSIYLALKEILSGNSKHEKLYIVRSLVPSREIGFLPGNHDDKSDIYQIPYKNMVKYMFKMPNDEAFDSLYQNLKTQETISFWSTSFLRGVTLDNAIIIVDEMQNLSGRELHTIMTRVGVNSKIIFCGDVRQTDLLRSSEKNGIYDFTKIIRLLEDDFSMVEFEIEDIVRSGLTKRYITAQHQLNLFLE
jgi:predicted ribonuclease YlaK